jgi:acyl carrier protein
MGELIFSAFLKDVIMNIQDIIYNILCDIVDIEIDKIRPDTYLIRELNAESIDLLELAVSINQAFNITVNEDDLFLRKLRLFLDQEIESNPEKIIQEKYPFLSSDRINEIMSDLEDGPVLKVKDLMHYVSCQLSKNT